MSETELRSWLFGQTQFTTEYYKLLIESVKSQFSAISSEARVHNWSYLLKAASLIATSKDSTLQDTALRIAQFCLQSVTDTTEVQKGSAVFILDQMANRMSINLSSERQLLSHGRDWIASFTGSVNWTKNGLEHSIWLRNGAAVDVNNFQREFWNALHNHRAVSVSAPTSAGKSYLVKQWIREMLEEKLASVIVYLVPTRALISEVQLDMQSSLSDKIATSRVNVTTFPFDVANEGVESSTIYVLTQERLQLLLAQVHSNIDVLIVDEAYKISDRERGILLQYVIEKTKSRNAAVKLVYISPQASNPEIFVDEEVDGYSKKFTDITVNQNLIWVKHVLGKKWTLQLCYGSNRFTLGDINLPNRPSPASFKLPMLAHYLGGKGGNILYVNGPSEAEKMAAQLCDLIGKQVDPPHPRILELIELCEKAIHRKFRLISVLRFGVGFHYGNIPLLIREEIEALFRDGIINYLVCTSTLIEGVNLPCKNLFVRAPKRGLGNPMTPEDFWNLAGRAGRWGKDFQGNIFCVDPEEWSAPEAKTAMPITRATEQALRNEGELLKFINDGTPREEAARPEKRIFESMASYLMASSKSFGGINRIPWMSKLPVALISKLQLAIDDHLSVDDIPSQLIDNHPGISPIAMRAMLQYFITHSNDPNVLLIPFASDSNAVTRFKEVMERFYGRLTNEFTNREKYLFKQAILVVCWMRGMSVRRIIDARHKAVPDEDIHTTIRTVLQDIESIARYKAPKFLSCYNDILRIHLERIGRSDLVDEIQDISLFLEMGVNTKTELSLINLGLSRTSSVELKEYISDDSLDEQQCLAWIRDSGNDWQSKDLPALVKREISRVVSIHN
ncbi:DEAD/DEAH box helicase [Chryseolinea sp. T2]|uniref:DEAD/DEAH box helicase n=1 Tax=Chryseolinea sp. T2 TaxID=3129255 RepID=UPI00307779B8